MASLRTKTSILAALLPLAAILLCAAAIPAAAPPRGKKKVAPAKPAASSAAAARTFAKDVSPVLQKYCVSCHGAKSPSADISLVGYRDAAGILKARAIWERVSSNVSAGHMPPAGSPQPTRDERDRLVGYVDATITQADCRLNDPGRVTMRRLNRAEYNNTIRDLTGVDVRPADEFPSDDVGYGFDNIGDVLSISPLLMEKYLKAADKVVRAVIVTPEERSRPVRATGPRMTGGPAQGDFPETDGRILFSNAEVGIEHTFPANGEYLLRVEAFGHQAGPEPCRVTLRVDGMDVRTFLVKAVQDKPENYDFRIKVFEGKQKVGVAFLNDYFDDKNPDPKLRGDRNLIVNAIEIQGPLPDARTGALPSLNLAPANLPESHRKIIPCQPTVGKEDACAREVLGGFARRAWRRPVTKAEVDRLLRYVHMVRKEGESFERGIQVALQAALVSPNFLFRVEKNTPPPAKKADKGLISDYELASRLSYFLWSSMPDDELLALAAKGRLQNPAVLAAQAKRMLKDPKAAKALSDNFASQWLQLRKLNTVTPDPKQFPNFNDGLRAAMRTETELFFQSIVRDDRSILEFLDANFTYLNEPLARHYGNTSVTGSDFRRVALVGRQRGGLLTQASILTVTSNPTRTSPVKRGKWVLEQILGTPPPPPPPGVAELPDDKKGKALTGTLRQRLEQHRRDPGCASCHRRMDPIGFGLENFDAVGAWRIKDGDAPVDSSGTLPDGKSFSGPVQLKAILLAKKPQFTSSFSEKMLTYALGRGVESADRCNVDKIAETVAKNGYRFSTLVTAIVTSDPFRKRRDEKPAAAPPVKKKIAAASRP